MRLTYFVLNFYSLIFFRILCSVFDVIRSEMSRMFVFCFLFQGPEQRLISVDINGIEEQKIDSEFEILRIRLT